MAGTKEVTWVITGAEGQLGRSFQKTLQSKGIEFEAVSRSRLDITDFLSVKQMISDLKPEVVINAAAYTNVENAELQSELAIQVNQTGASNIAKSCKLSGARLVHFSTDYVFSGKNNSPWQDDDKTEPISNYGKSKLAGELAIVREYPEKSLIIRTAWLYSPFGKNFYKTILAKALGSKEEIRVVSDQVGQPTSAIDVADLTIKALSSNVSAGIFHATNSGESSWYEFARFIFELAGEDVNRVIPISSAELVTSVERPKYSVLSNSKWQHFGLESMKPWQESARSMFPDILKSLNK